MTTTTEALTLHAQIIDALHDDGDTFTLSDGRTIRLKIEPDQDYSINDYDGDGRISDAFSYNRDHHTSRPSDFNGAAVKLQVDRGYYVWWQPPGPDIIGPTPWTHEQFEKERARIQDLASFGFVGLILELCDATRDAYNNLTPRATASLWSIEWNIMGDPYHIEILDDLLTELDV